MSAADLGRRVERPYEQPPDAVSCYADMTQMVRTSNEVIMQFYEAIPGVPKGPAGPEVVRMILRATITLNVDHARRIVHGLGEALGESGKVDG